MISGDAHAVLARRDDAVAALEAAYDRLDDAIAARDLERLAALVADREPLVARLRRLLADSPLAFTAGQRLATREAELQRRIRDLHGHFETRLHDTQRRANAARKYQESSR